MGFLGDIANSGIGSDLLSLYNAQKEVESRDTLRQIQQQQLEEKKRADLANEQIRRDTLANNRLQRALQLQEGIGKALKAGYPEMAKPLVAEYQGIFPDTKGLSVEALQTMMAEHEKNPYRVVSLPNGTPVIGQYVNGEFKPYAPKEIKAPQHRSITREDRHVDQEFDSETNTWKDISSGPRYKPTESPQEAASKEAEKVSARHKAWRKTFKETMGREPTPAENRAKLINDPLGMLGGAEGEGAPAGQQKPLDAKTAKSLLDEAGGDKNKARELAKKRGYTF